MTRREYALEIRRHWAEELLSGGKTVELRGYPLPEAVGSNRVWLLATDGPAGRAALGDTIDPLRDRERAEIVGWVRFEKSEEKAYRSTAEVEADSGEHLVSSSSSSWDVYGWREGATEALFGWKVAEARRCGGAGGGGARGAAAGQEGTSSSSRLPLPLVPLAPGTRLLRSVYLLERAPAGVE